MSLKQEVIDYLDAIREDSYQPQRIDKYRQMILTKSFHETHEYSQKVAGLIKHLFEFMPELEKADPTYIKLYPLFLYCENLSRLKKRPDIR